MIPFCFVLSLAGPPISFGESGPRDYSFLQSQLNPASALPETVSFPSTPIITTNGVSVLSPTKATLHAAVSPRAKLPHPTAIAPPPPSPQQPQSQYPSPTSFHHQHRFTKTLPPSPEPVYEKYRFNKVSRPPPVPFHHTLSNVPPLSPSSRAPPLPPIDHNQQLLNVSPDRSPSTLERYNQLFESPPRHSYATNKSGRTAVRTSSATPLIVGQHRPHYVCAMCFYWFTYLLFPALLW